MSVSTEVEGTEVKVPQHQKFIMHHAGLVPGLAGTTRVNLWFDAQPTKQLMTHLLRLVDALGIEGIESVICAESGQHFKVQLIIDDSVFVSTAAALWIERFNEHIARQPEQVLEYLADEDSTERAKVTDSKHSVISYIGSD